MSDSVPPELTDALLRMRADRARERLLWEKDVGAWSDDDMAWMIARRYAPTQVPPCRVCGLPLTIASQGSAATEWACGGMEDNPDEPGTLRWQSGRTPADDHYLASRFVDQRRGGDDAVMELLRRAQVAEARVAQLESAIRGRDTEPSREEFNEHNGAWLTLTAVGLPEIAVAWMFDQREEPMAIPINVSRWWKLDDDGCLMVEPDVERPRICWTCGKPAACRGVSEDEVRPRYSCDDCCGHGGEDGHCEPVTRA